MTTRAKRGARYWPWPCSERSDWIRCACGRRLRPDGFGSIVAEAAQAGVNSSGLGGPAQIPDDLKAAALQRVMAFDQRGTVRA